MHLNTLFRYCIKCLIKIVSLTAMTNLLLHVLASSFAVNKGIMGQEI